MGTARGLERLLMFLDAVVAIAITLLVLPLVEVAGADPPATVGALLDEHSAQLGGFALSFAAIGRLWLAHHGLYEHVSAYDRAVVLLNLAWAATIVVLPFATPLVVQFGTDRGAVVIYMGCLAVSSCLLTATMWHMRRQPELLRDTASLDPLGAAGTSVAFILALALGAAGLGYWPLLLLTVDGRVTALLRKAPTRD